MFNDTKILFMFFAGFPGIGLLREWTGPNWWSPVRVGRAPSPHEDGWGLRRRGGRGRVRWRSRPRMWLPVLGGISAAGSTARHRCAHRDGWQAHGVRRLPLRMLFTQRLAHATTRHPQPGHAMLPEDPARQPAGASDLRAGGGRQWEPADRVQHHGTTVDCQIAWASQQSEVGFRFRIWFEYGPQQVRPPGQGARAGSRDRRQA